MVLLNKIISINQETSYSKFHFIKDYEKKFRNYLMIQINLFKKDLDFLRIKQEAFWSEL